MKFMKENYILELVISPLYQAIRDFPTLGVPLGAGDANYSELISDKLFIQIIAQFRGFMEMYQFLDVGYEV